jgi:hypothetical protein
LSQLPQLLDMGDVRSIEHSVGASPRLRQLRAVQVAWVQADK